MPSAAGPSGAGSGGAGACAPRAAGLLAITVEWGFAPSDLPGSSAEASAARAAVNAATPAISHPRARPIRPSAASRSSAAEARSDRLRGSPGMAISSSKAISDL
jgi:hypothetical protein